HCFQPEVEFEFVSFGYCSHLCREPLFEGHDTVDGPHRPRLAAQRTGVDHERVTSVWTRQGHRTFTRWSVAGRTGHFLVRVLPDRPARAYRSRTGDAHGRTTILPTMRPTTQISSGELCSVLSRTDAQPADVGPGRRRLHCPARSAYFFRNRSCTYDGTRLDTSPLCWAISRTRLEERNEYCGFAVMNTVSTPESR